MKFSSTAQDALAAAKAYAEQFKSRYAGTEHLLLGLIESHDDILDQTFSRLDVDRTHLKDIVISILNIEETNKLFKSDTGPQFTPRVLRIIDFAKNLAQKLDKSTVDVIHLFLSLLYENDGVATSILMEYGLNFDNVKNAIQKELGDITSTSNVLKSIIPESLEPYFIDLTYQASVDELQSTFSRDAEFDKIYLVLGKKHNTNLIITGEPGVGKKSVVYELARRITKKLTPNHLHHKRILELKLKTLIGGTKFRGDFEARMDTLQEYLKANTDVILFINDIALITRIDGSANIEEYFSELFNSDDINFIGTCTSDDYKKYIDDITTISSNFENIVVKQTDLEETKGILYNMIPMYEKFHNVKYNRNIIEDIVKLSSRFIFDKSQPAAALDLLDECGSHIKNQISNTSEQIVQIQQKIDGIQKQKYDAVREFNFEEGIKLRRKETTLFNKLKKEIIKQKAVEFDKIITEDIVRDILSIKTNIPISNIKGSSLPDLNKVEQSLKEKYISQDHAITSLLQHFKRVKTGLQDPNRPLGSFLFIGPTGVGKTYLCELISEYFFYNKQNYLKIDMSEFMEPHSTSKLIGSPPGYIGYGDRSILCDFIKRNPYSLLLLDEIEKAHPDVVNIFLQVLDKGELTDSVGRKINFKNCIIVFTSNIGSELFNKDSIGFGGTAISSIDLENACQKFFKPEFLNRLDEIIRFEHLSKEDIYNLVQIQLNVFSKKLQEINNIELILTPEVRDYIAAQGYNRKYGARFLRRFFEKHIETEIASLLIKSKTQLKKITCKIKDKKLIYV
jgi:ATP-dependent Clp protease ATP-binding subunit ClpC